ncbi:hypothetical protein A2415_02265 [candidate division WWE3 bacterium RIFOXYC1_FULL_39_7]|uniref:Uncharacterized protein n=1 Tax=candidate division WWE3 bacterium RIFOXYC1_FULL_39_7 TaxID=1802643 RepID=A0A1F4WGW6_UNCKA|nr:MAG: hypothetical protein A2415_02265 [candidate division WWE3 bacterium RIFOXYC1_FULL_39_7]
MKKLALIPMVGLVLLMLVCIFGIQLAVQAAPLGEISTEVYLYNSDGRADPGEVLTTTLNATIQSNVFNWTDGPIDAFVEFGGVYPEWEPALGHSGNITGTVSYDPELGVYTWQGVIPAMSVAEFWVPIKNVSYQITSHFQVSFSLDGIAVPAVQVGIYNPTPPPPPAPDEYKVYLPLVIKPEVEQPVLGIDVSASDGTSDSRETGVLTTTKSYAVNFAAYSLVADQLTAVVTFSGFEDWNVVTKNEPGLVGEWTENGGGRFTWQGILDQGIGEITELWIEVPAGYHGTHQFTVDAQVIGRSLVYAGHVTVIVP